MILMRESGAVAAINNEGGDVVRIAFWLLLQLVELARLFACLRKPVCFVALDVARV